MTLLKLLLTCLAALSVAQAAPLELKLNLLMDGEPLDWEATYRNAVGQDFTVNLLKFYISDLALVNADGSEVPLETLELISFGPGDETQDVTLVTLDAPEGTYSGVRFDVGVPRELNHLDATLQTAPLGVDAGMYWAWNPGYIFYRLEGQVELDGRTEPWLLHMGTDAFRLPVRAQDLLTGTVTVEVAAEGGELSFDLDVMEAFSSGLAGSPYDFSQGSYRAVHGGPVSAQAYVNMLNAFTLSGVAETAGQHGGEGQAHSAGHSSAGHSSARRSGTGHGQEHSAAQDAAEHGGGQNDAAQHGGTQDETADTSDTSPDALSVGGGDISGRLSLPESVEDWDAVIVVACRRDDPRCEDPAAVVSPEPDSASTREADFILSVPAGEYAVYGLNDLDGNLAHTMDGGVAEALGLWAVPGTFDPLFVVPPATGVSFELIGTE